MNAYKTIKRILAQPVEINRIATSRVTGKRRKPRIGLLVVHGMGQQIRFETLDRAVEGLSRVARIYGGVEASLVKVGPDELIERLSFEMEDRNKKRVDVDVYEGYWAPVTEGHVRIKDVLRFLFAGAKSGLFNFRRFQRWLFGRQVEFHIPASTPLSLLLATGVLVALILINVVAGLVWASRVSGVTLTSQSWPSDTLFRALSLEVLGFTAISFFVAACLVLAIWLCGRHNGRPSHSPLRKGATWLVQQLLSVWYLFACLVGVLMMVTVGVEYFWSKWVHSWLHESVPGEKLAGLFALTWATLLAISWKVRGLLIRYMGDVAAYVSPHTLDRFDGLRTRIKQRVYDVAKAIYSAKTAQGRLVYDRVAIVAHSLGTVVAYDALNAMLSRDEVDKRKLKVADRTSAFVTFGSPLDKTAYIFGLQSSHTSETRHLLAAAVQPLIQDYRRFRSRLQWINVFSKRDVVSGPLNFYDDPKNAPFPVKNVHDDDALIPLVAHVEYWKNNTVFQELHRAM